MQGSLNHIISDSRGDDDYFADGPTSSASSATTTAAAHSLPSLMTTNIPPPPAAGAAAAAAAAPAVVGRVPSPLQQLRSPPAVQQVLSSLIPSSICPIADSKKSFFTLDYIWLG